MPKNAAAVHQVPGVFVCQTRNLHAIGVLASTSVVVEHLGIILERGRSPLALGTLTMYKFYTNAGPWDAMSA